MSTSRRDFVEHIATGAVMFGAAPSALAAMPIGKSASRTTAAGPWDMSWTDRVRGKYKVVSDCAEIAGGSGVARGTVWAMGYADAMGVKASDCSTVVVVRHTAIALAMNSAFWAEYKLGEKHKENDMVTNKPATRNPSLLNSKEHGSPAEYDDMILDKLIARGGVVLGCALAFEEIIDTVKTQDKVSDAATKEKAMKMMVPGVILQPSGVFAVIRAQQAGCWYMHGS